MSEIKACWHCGSSDVEMRVEANYIYVACTNCGPGIRIFSPAGDARRAARSKREILEAWNTRPIEDELAASRDRASDACASVQRERDALREVLGHVRVLLAMTLTEDNGSALDEAFIWEPPIARRPLITFGMLRALRRDIEAMK